MSDQLPLFDLDKGRERRDAGIALVESHAERFVDEARDVARLLCRLYSTCTNDDLQARIQPPPGSHPNIWGSIFHHKDFKMVGRVQSKRPDAHARWIGVWALK